jgi:hypothetical protein
MCDCPGDGRHGPENGQSHPRTHVLRRRLLLLPAAYCRMPAFDTPLPPPPPLSPTGCAPMIFHISDTSGAVRFIVEIAICQVCTLIRARFHDAALTPASLGPTCAARSGSPRSRTHPVIEPTFAIVCSGSAPLTVPSLTTCFFRHRRWQHQELLARLQLKRIMLQSRQL